MDDIQTYGLFKKMNFFIKEFFSKCDQIPSILRNLSHLLKKSLIGNFIFCAVMGLCIKQGFLNEETSAYISNHKFKFKGTFTF